MMFDQARPFKYEPWQCEIGYRPRRVVFDQEGNPKEPLGFISDPPLGDNWEQMKEGELQGGNAYFNLFGNGYFYGNGAIFLYTINVKEEYSGIKEIDQYNEQTTGIYHKCIFADFDIYDRFEDHIPFRGVKYQYKIKKRTIVKEQDWEIKPPTSGGTFWTSEPGEIRETTNEEQEVSLEVPCPQDIDLQKHEWRSIDLSIDDQVNEGYRYPGYNGNFFDGTKKHGYEHDKEVRVYRKIFYDETDPTKYQPVLLKITWTEIRYDLNTQKVKAFCTPAGFYNQQ